MKKLAADGGCEPEVMTYTGQSVEQWGEPVNAHDIAQRSIEDLWDDIFAFGVIETALKRLGRGHSSSVSNKKGWRYEERHSELDRFDNFTRGLIENLRLGLLTATMARQKIDQAGYSGFLFVADSKEQMVKTFSNLLIAGDNVWVEVNEDPDLPGNRVSHIRCWYDPSHRRVI